MGSLRTNQADIDRRATATRNASPPRSPSSPPARMLVGGPVGRGASGALNVTDALPPSSPAVTLYVPALLGAMNEVVATPLMVEAPSGSTDPVVVEKATGAAGNFVAIFPLVDPSSPKVTPKVVPGGTVVGAPIACSWSQDPPMLEVFPTSVAQPGVFGPPLQPHQLSFKSAVPVAATSTPMFGRAVIRFWWTVASAKLTAMAASFVRKVFPTMTMFPGARSATPTRPRKRLSRTVAEPPARLTPTSFVSRNRSPSTMTWLPSTGTTTPSEQPPIPRPRKVTSLA